MPYIVMCRVSGGVTGTREAPLKRDHVIRLFETEAEAAAEAARLDTMMNRNFHRTADFRYWPKQIWKVNP